MTGVMLGHVFIVFLLLMLLLSLTMKTAAIMPENSTSQGSVPDLRVVLSPLMNTTLHMLLGNPETLPLILPTLVTLMGLGSGSSWPISPEDSGQSAITALAETKAALSPMMSVQGVGQICQTNLFEILEGISSKQPWALQILDSYGKPEPGILQGNFHWLGHYDQCLDFYITPRTAHLDPANPTDFHTKYCRLKIQALNRSMILGSCVPKSCSSHDIQGVYVAIYGAMNVTEPSVPSVECVEDKRLGSASIAAICIFTMFGFMITFGTLYDVINTHLISDKIVDNDPNQQKSLLERSAKDVGKGEIFILNGESINSTCRSRNNWPNGLIFPLWNGGARYVSTVYIADDMERSLEEKTETPKPLMNLTTSRESESGSLMPVIKDVLRKILLSFSAYSNGKKLLSTSKTTGNIEAIYGLRFLSMTWVILGHVIIAGGILTSSGFSSNIARYIASKTMSDWTFLAIINGSFSVDSFFTLSGLLLSYLTLKKLQKVGGAKRFNWFLFYSHRFWRLTPVYMLVLMVGYVLLPLLLDGPLFGAGDLVKNCKKTWWANLLFVHNLVFKDLDNMCMPWTWYLAADMQFFVISPFMILPLFYNVFVGVVTCMMFLAVTVGVTASIAYTNKYSPQPISPFVPPPENHEALYNLYLPSYTRIGPYVVGVFTGFLMYRWNCKCKINKYVNLVLWILALSICCVITYSIYNEWNSNVFSISGAAAYWALARVGWGIAWIIFACATGNGGFINTLLSWSPFIPLGRLTFCAYLIHPFIIGIYLHTLRQELYYTDVTLAYEFIGHLVFSFGGAFLTSLAFEAPILAIEKVFLN